MGPRTGDRVDLSGERRVRVLQIIGRLNMGGPAHVAALIAGRRFHPERYETLLVHGTVAAGEASLADLAEEEGATLRFVPELRQPVRPPRDAQALAKLIGIVRAFRPDVVHTHTAKAGFLGRQAALALRPRPVVAHTYHGHVLEGYFGPAKARTYLMLERALARSSDCLTAVSQATVEDLVRLGVAPASKFRVLPLGLDLDALTGIEAAERDAARRALGLGADDVALIFVGRIVPIKRLDLLLEAFSRARHDGPRLRLLVVGDGGGRGELEAQAARLGVGEAVSFLGYRRELRPLFAAADLAVLSSDNEGTPVSLIEAAAAGLPAVATDAGGVREVVTEGTGTLVSRGDAAALAAAIECMAGDAELRARCGALARSRAIERFGAQRLIDDTDALYRELLAQ